jgi:hypothetical protein
MVKIQALLEPVKMLVVLFQILAPIPIRYWNIIAILINTALLLLFLVLLAAVAKMENVVHLIVLVLRVKQDLVEIVEFKLANQMVLGVLANQILQNAAGIVQPVKALTEGKLTIAPQIIPNVQTLPLLAIVQVLAQPSIV